MKQVNIFSEDSLLHPMRWFIVASAVFIGWLGYADYTGWRILTFNSQQTWSASGPGGHK